jgi:hypothetical protein
LKAFGVYLRKMRTYTCGNPLNMEWQGYFCALSAIV